MSWLSEASVNRTPAEWILDRLSRSDAIVAGKLCESSGPTLSKVLAVDAGLDERHLLRNIMAVSQMRFLDDLSSLTNR